MRSVVVLLGLSLAAHAQWPQPKHASDAYEFVQKQRAEAEKLWGRKDPKGISMLEDAMRYLQQPLVRDLATGDPYLAARLTNLQVDLATAYAVAGQPDRSIAVLRKLEPNSALAQYLEKAESFATLRERPDFQEALRGLRSYEKFWDTPALGTPYQPNLTDTEKIAGLSRFWSDVKYNFGYPEKLVTLDWDGLYTQWISKVLVTETTHEYYQELAAFCAKLSDGHTNVFPPRELDISSKPPMRTGLIEGRVLILDVPSAKLRSLGIATGMEILEVDGQNAVKYGKSIASYHSTATPQDAQTRTFWYAYLRGPKAEPVKLTLRDASGKTTTVAVPRDGYDDVSPRAVVDYKQLPDAIGYVALNDFGSNEAVKQWNALLPRILATNGLILDLRLNGGGSSNIGWDILASLVTEPFLGSRQVMRTYNPTLRARGASLQFVETAPSKIQPRDQGYGTKPIVVLTGPATYSAAEDFMVAWKNAKRGKTIGEPTGGSTGQPLFITLPGGGSARICTKRDTFPDGTEWVGKGIEPDIVVRPTVADIQAGRDPVVEAAIKAVTTK